MTNIYEATAERMQSYYQFADEIVDNVANVAAEQAGMSAEQFYDRYSIPEPQQIHLNGSRYPISVLDIKPQVDYDPAQVRVMHLAMGNGLDSNQRYQVATVFAADPTVRTVAFGNPGAPGNRQGLLSVKDTLQVARGNTRPLVDASLRYLSTSGAIETEQDGYSYGTLAANTATEHAEKYDMNVSQVTNIEPADVKARGIKLKALATLAADFGKTGSALKGYVEANEIDAFVEERGDSILGMAGYILGLGRFNNIARTSAMANEMYEMRSERALLAQPDARMHTVWGSESELAVDGAMNLLSCRMRIRFPDRYSSTRIQGQKHAMVNDLALQSALLQHARQI